MDVIRFTDRDGDVWIENRDSRYKLETSMGSSTWSREQIEREYGPLVPLVAANLPPVIYTDWYAPGVRLKRCLSCGSLVPEDCTEVHTNWHNVLDGNL